MRRSRVAMSALATVATFLSGCGKNFSDIPTPAPVSTSISSADVGQVNIDIVSIDQFYDVASRFQSNYGLSGQAALKTVNQASSFENLAAIGSTTFGIGAEADGPIVANNTSGTKQSTTTNGVTTGTATSTQTNSSSQSTPTAAPSIATPASTPVPATSFSGAPALAPMVNYQAADALFRYAAVLDGGIGQISPCGWVPILVTFRISIIPAKRYQPYDTYLDLSVLPGPFDEYIGKSDTDGASATQGGSPSSHPLTSSEANATSLKPPTASEDRAYCGYQVRNDDLNIVSFSSDALENAQSDVLQQQAKALILAAAIRAGTVAASSSFQNLSQNIDHTLGLRPNSLISVGRTGKNTLHIRLGANRFGSNDYELLPLEHDISIVLLVPIQFANPIVITGSTDSASTNTTASGRQALNQTNLASGSPITVVGHYYFMDARSGGGSGSAADPLPDSDPRWEKNRINYLARVAQTIEDEYGAVARENPIIHNCAAGADASPICRELSNAAYNIPNETLPAFGREIWPNEPTEEIPPDKALVALDLWQRLTSISARPGMTPRVSRYTPRTLRSCPPDSDVLVQDDGTNTIVSLTGADHYDGWHITATLALKTKSKSLTLSKGFDIGGPDIGDLMFPSVANVFSKGDTVTGILNFVTRDNLICPSRGDYKVAYVLKEKSDTSKNPGGKTGSAGLSAFPGQIIENSGSGSVSFTVSLTDLKADTAVVSSDSAGQLDAISTVAAPLTSIAAQKGTVSLTASGDYVAHFANLTPGNTLTLSVQYKKKGKAISKSTIVLKIEKG